MAQSVRLPARLSPEGHLPYSTLERTLLINRVVTHKPITRVGTITLLSMVTGGRMTLLDDIYQWSKDLPAWQRDALRRLFQSAKLSANDIRELLAMVKQEHG